MGGFIFGATYIEGKKVNKRILHIVGDSEFGGGAIIILSIAAAARRAGYDVSILTTSPKFQEAAVIYGIDVVPLDCIWRKIRPFADMKGLFLLAGYLKNNRYDIVHTHTSKAGFVGRAAARFAKVPAIIHTVHGFAFHEQSSCLTVGVYSALERLAAHWCDKIVTVSDYHRKWALDLAIGDEDKVVSIPNGIPATRVQHTLEKGIFRAGLGVGENQTLLVSAGRLAPQKGIEYLIDAVRVLVDEGRYDVHLLLAGDGPLRFYLESKVRDLNLQSHISFLGFRTDVADILFAADIIVMPTEREGLSVALLEAMAAKRPIITTNIGSNLEVTDGGKFARLVIPKSSEELVLAIKNVLSDPEGSSKMLEMAYSHFTENYTEHVMLAKYMSLYDDCLAH